MNNQHRLKISAYTVGFLLSVYLTLTAYFLVVKEVFPPLTLTVAVITLALVQFAVQVIFFLHVGEEAKPRWHVKTFGYTVLVVAILVIGSLWIMANLDYHHGKSMSPAQTDEYIIKDEGIKTH